MDNMLLKSQINTPELLTKMLQQALPQVKLGIHLPTQVMPGSLTTNPTLIHGHTVELM